MRRVTFSRNLTLSLSRTCRCYCKYCAFATHQAHVHPPEAVIDPLHRAKTALGAPPAAEAPRKAPTREDVFRSFEAIQKRALTGASKRSD